MNMRELLRSLSTISEIPAKDPETWLSAAEQSVNFLKEHIIKSDRLILFASAPYVLIHTVLAPLKNLHPPDREDLSRDFVMPDDAWMIEHVSGGGRPDQVYLSPPLGRRGNTLRDGEKLYFSRSFAGSPRRSIEISQKLVHSLDLHFMEERNAYCRLDEDGDLEDVISVYEAREKDWLKSMTVVSILSKEFTEYMRLSDMGMVVFFDFTRVRYGSFSSWDGQQHFEHKAKDLFYHGGVLPGHASYVNGRLIARPQITIEEIVEAHKEARDPSSRQYAVFKAFDFKNNTQVEVSCAPEALSNYFQPESKLPFEMSPAFFKAEVLHKYKSDPEKYELSDRSISCRGTWSLNTYDINEAGQIHTYLRYLRDLPYNEQLYWQSFNEWPKAPLSKRAFTTDFKGEFFTEYDSLNSLKQKIRQWDERPPAWWQPRGEELARAVHYPATTAPNEWANEILALDHLVIEGFILKELRSLAKRRGRKPAAEWQSLKLLEECLVGADVDDDVARDAVGSLRRLREMRNVLKGHAATEKRKELEKNTRIAFGSFRTHFADLAADCDAAIDLIAAKLSLGI
jgi:hypothetical protein